MLPLALPLVDFLSFSNAQSATLAALARAFSRTTHSLDGPSAMACSLTRWRQARLEHPQP